VIDTALVLAAGLGTRLAPLSAIRAKAALPVAGTVLIRRQLQWLAAAGITRVVVNLHHLPATITRVVGYGADLGVDVTYSWEARVLGSAGGPRRALDLIDRDRFLIVNGDTLTDLDLGALAAAHAGSGALVTMAAVAARPGYNSLRVVHGQFRGVIPAGRPAEPGAVAGHFIGIQVADGEAFAAMPADQPAETLRGLYEELTAAAPGAVRVRIAPAAFHDIGTPAEYLRTVQALARTEGRPLDRGDRTSIAATARVEASICWDDVHIGERAEVVGCIAADRARVPAGFKVRDAVLVPDTGRAPGPRDRVVDGLLVAPFAPPGAARG
jgi:mannose-1-phosphate guanylyltransferase